MSGLPFPPILPIPQIPNWAGMLASIAAQPLAFCPNFPKIARRHEVFWVKELVDRPLFIASVNKNPARPITKRLELIHDPDAWFEAKFADMQQIHRVGDALPTIRPDFGPVMLGRLFGGKTEYGANTTWTHAFIQDDWSNAPSWTIDECDPLWQHLQVLLKRIVQNAVGCYLVQTPNLGASSDVLLNLRGAERLALDTIDQPAQITRAVDAIYPAWRKAFMMLWEHVVEQGAGLIHFVGMWASAPHTVLECDFNALIGPGPFQELFLPDIRRQAATVGRAIFHLDGPDAARHVDTLLDVPELQAIQYVPGTGTPSALDKLAMLRKIQRRGKALQIVCPFEEVLPLCDSLEPAGLAFLVDNVPDAKGLDSLFAQFCRRFGAVD
jgi:hypothetical protein